MPDEKKPSGVLLNPRQFIQQGRAARQERQLLYERLRIERKIADIRNGSTASGPAVTKTAEPQRGRPPEWRAKLQQALWFLTLDPDWPWHSQAELERRLIVKMESRYDKGPAESTVRNFVKKQEFTSDFWKADK
jgi:hypothetical protein